MGPVLTPPSPLPQISLLAMPFVCLIGWFIGKPFLLSIDVFALFSTIMR